jgi:hypothetical protein
MSFPPGTEMFQFPGFASHAYVFSMRYALLRGLPHSDIFGSKLARSSPKLFAACHVLHRLLVPRHPPNALLSFNISLHPNIARCAMHLGATHIIGNSNEISNLPTMHRNHLSEFILAPHSTRPVCAPVLTYNYCWRAIRTTTLRSGARPATLTTPP